MARLTRQHPGPVLDAGLPGEDEIDRVLGKDGDEGEECDREPLRYVELRDFGGPRHQEGCPEDRQTEQQRVERRGFVHRAEDVEAHQRGGSGQEGSADDEGPLLARVSQLVGRPLVGHGPHPTKRIAPSRRHGRALASRLWTQTACSLLSQKAITKRASCTSSTSPRARRRTQGRSTSPPSCRCDCGEAGSNGSGRTRPKACALPSTTSSA